MSMKDCCVDYGQCVYKYQNIIKPASSNSAQVSAIDFSLSE